MACSLLPLDEHYAALPFPLKHATTRASLEPQEILSRGMGVFGSGDHQNRPQIATPRAEFALINLGRLPVL